MRDDPTPAPRALAGVLAALALAGPAAGAERPNVVLVVTDDQGFGDLGFHGNPVLRTPRLDGLARESARLETFYVHPVCTPTRAALMTGRAPQRTRAFDTWIGRAMLEPDELTLAELLAGAGYATGIFGKWHLGDCYPMRALDQGFQRALVHRGGGIGQPSDPEGGEGRYTDPVLESDGERYEARGYCTDVFFDAAIEWLREQRAAERPFFAYVATNAPHAPLGDVPEDLLAHYRAQDLSPGRFPQEDGHPLPESIDADRTARIYAMVEGIDRALGRLLDALRELEIERDTLVVVLFDNGPDSRRYVGGFRGRKSDVHEGGVRSPLLLRWPGRLAPGASSDRVASDVDVLPTVLEACGVAPPPGVALDGRSLLPLLDGREVDWRDRAVVIQAHRGDAPRRHQHFLVRTQRWKLVNPTGFGPELAADEPAALRPELYDMRADPYELRDVAGEHPEVVAELLERYEAWFDSLAAERADPFAPPRIALGGEAPREVALTRQDWRRIGAGNGWARRARGAWQVQVVEAGPWRARVRFPRGTAPRALTLRCGALERAVELAAGATEHTLDGLRLPVGPARLEVELRDEAGAFGPHQVLLTRGAPAGR